ncbi:MAG TPA: divalent metal cation transporter [Roseiarcus sp.]|nr:divalent metal cation transporter [Roseiarcus sp.]
MSNGLTASAPTRAGVDWRRTIALAGPGIVVMLADTDAGSVVTAAQSGAQWGYRLLLLQFALIPVLYIVQELTVRLGVVTGRGHAVLIKQHFGRFWAWVSVSTLMIACIGALLTELSGLAGVGDMLGVPMWATMTLTVGALVAIAVTGSYLSVERIAIAIGAFELAFLLVAWLAKPGLGEVARQSLEMPLSDPKYLLLVSANIGAVIMPWMVFYQQSSVVEKGLKIEDLAAARADTAFGAVATQLTMAAVLVAAAAALSQGGTGAALDTVQEIAQAFTPVLGEWAGRLAFALGVSGASLVAAIVVTLTAARTLGELMSYHHSLEHSLREAPWFYAVYAAVLVIGAAIVMSGANLVTLSVSVQVMNALLLPIVLGFLFLLARRLPPPFRLAGRRAVMTAGTIIVAVALGLYAGVAGLWG